MSACLQRKNQMNQDLILFFLEKNPSEQIADPEYIILVSRSGSKTLIRAEAMTGNIQDAEDLLSILNESLS